MKQLTKKQIKTAAKDADKITIGTLLKNKKSGSMAIVLREIPVLPIEAHLTNLANLNFGDDNYTEEEKKLATLRYRTINEDLGDEWEDRLVLLKRLTFTDAYHHFSPELPYNPKRVTIDWEIISG